MIKKFVRFVLLLCIAVGVFFFWWKQITLPVDLINKESYIFVIPQGMGSGDIAKKLKKADLIKNVLAFQIMITKQGISNKLQAGDFRLSPSMNLFEITEALTHGIMDVWVTIPEGLRKEEIARIITDNFEKYNADFDADKFLTEAKNMEGYLFPDTYLIPKDASPSAVIRIFANTFELKYQSLKCRENLTKKDLVTLASLIEREAKYDKDRALISGILIKRLENDWPLQVDASVQYAKATINNQQLTISNSLSWWPIVNSGDLQMESPYNTYLNKELPPAPICNPGVGSLKAAAEPQDSKYWFYLSDDSGKIYYAETIEEHKENIEKYLN